MSSHGRAYAYFGGVAEITVTDNLCSGVKVANRYEPELNATYWAMAEHYSTTVIPAPPRRPRDKAKLEETLTAAQLGLPKLLARSLVTTNPIESAFSVAGKVTSLSEAQPGVGVCVRGGRRMD